jgi:hypothetical protein
MKAFKARPARESTGIPCIVALLWFFGCSASGMTSAGGTGGSTLPGSGGSSSVDAGALGGTSAAGGSTAACTPGNTQACICPPDVPSFQTCSDAGVWGPCLCPDQGSGGAAAGGTGAGGTAPSGGGTAAGGTTAGGTAGGGTAGGGTGTGGAGTGTGGAGTGTGGAGTGTGGAGTGTGGAATGGEAGAAPVQKDCATITVVTSGFVTDFEDYDGVTDAGEWGFAFNGEAGDETAVYSGPFAYDDGTGDPFFGMVAGNDSNYGVGISNTEASEWGGGLGMWMGCVDATSFTGIEFHVRGSAPMGTATLTLSMEDTNPPAEEDPAGGGTCIATGEEGECTGPSAEFEVTDAWTLVQLPWSSFTDGTAAAGVSVSATGNEITGFTINVNLEWIENPDNADEWIPAPAAYELAVDDLSFY